jgi:hypothetical protein
MERHTLRKWVDVDALQIVSRHVTGSLAIVVGFVVLRFVVEKAVHGEGALAIALDYAEQFGLACVFINLVVNTVREFINRGIGRNTHAIFSIVGIGL